MVQDSPSRHQDQFVLRLPEGMRERITESAKSNNRSMNSEIVAILEKAFLPSLSGRLQALLDQINSARIPSRLTPSKVAELIGEGNANAVEDAFAGKGGLSFSQINSIANLWGARPDWLKHGSGATFPVSRGHGFPVEAAAQFLKSKAERLLFLRSRSNAGELIVIIDHGNGVFESVDAGIHLSMAIGAAGIADNGHFSNACRYLWKNGKTRVASYLIDDDVFSTLIRGDIYPGVVMNQSAYSPWVEDWWDEEQFSKGRPDAYWRGYRAFCEHINSCIDADTKLKKERDAVVAGAWMPSGR